MDQPVSIVTGASRGIGLAIVEHLLTLGHFVVGCSRSAMTTKSPHHMHWSADVADQEEIQRLFASLRHTHGRVDNLVNCAGIASMNAALLTPSATVAEIMRTNYVGMFVVSSAAARLMQARRYGRIVNFTSVAVPLLLQGEAAYAASKAAVESSTRIFARELGGLGITVNAIGPNPVLTDMLTGVSDASLTNLISRQAIQRYGTFEDIFNVLDFFLSPASSFVTGQVLYLGGVS